MKNIVIAGFMGTGKTKVAKILSARLNMKYVSTDRLVEEKEGISIREIFSKKGEGHFRKAENGAIKDAALMENVVIDAGGGVVVDPENLKNLKKKGMVVCLWADPGIILERTKKYTHRPLLNVRDPLGKIKELLKSRRPFYERADCHIDTSAMSAEEAADEIEGVIKNARTNR